MQRDPWHNDFPLDPAQVADIVAADVPDVRAERVVALGEGWDYTTFLVDDEWVFRFPKRHQSARALARERRTLDALARTLADDPVAIPHYRFFVRESAAFALPYGGYALLRGDALLDCACDQFDAAEIGRQLGGFLDRLQRAAPTRAPRIYHDSFPGDLVEFRRELADARAALPESIAAACQRVLATNPPPDPSPPVFQHADLGAEHILVDRNRGRISAIIDWGDAGWGNSVADLVGLWAWGGDRAVHAASSAWQHDLSRDDWRRLRLWGIAYAIGSAWYGYKDRRDPLHAAALGWLQRMQAAGQLADPDTPDA